MRDMKISKNRFLYNSVRFLLILAFIVICIGCAEDKVVTPPVDLLEGTWAEEYTMQFGWVNFSDSLEPIKKTLTSMIHFSGGKFDLKIIDDSSRVLESLSGKYVKTPDVIVFHDLSEDLPVICGGSEFKMHFRIDNNDTLNLSMAILPDIIMVNPIGFIWLVYNQEAGITQPIGTKISGVFIRQ